MVLHEARLSRSVSVAVDLAVLAEEAMRKSASLVLSPDVASPLSLSSALHVRSALRHE